MPQVSHSFVDQLISGTDRRFCPKRITLMIVLYSDKCVTTNHSQLIGMRSLLCDLCFKGLLGRRSAIIIRNISSI